MVAAMQPKAFISYSWTSERHQQFVKELAERLIGDGVDVVMDLFDLREGHDKYVFMERMVTDPKITHVLALCDKAYAQKADARKAGVGTESQILSKEIYDQVVQTKIVPIVCEFADDGSPTLPIFFQSRIYVDFSSAEAVNRNWEQLIRLLYGKPLHQKPTPGKPPAYLASDASAPADPATAKFNGLRQAYLQGNPNVSLYRQDFLDACLQYGDSLRVRTRPAVDSDGNRALEDSGKLVALRDHIVDWVLLESRAPASGFSQALTTTLEHLRELGSRPTGVQSWDRAWTDAQAVSVYETFLYIVAALLKTGSYSELRYLFTTKYLIVKPYLQPELESFATFETESELLNEVLAPPGRRLNSPAAELIKRQAQRTGLPFQEVMQAELLVLLMAYVTANGWWFPRTLHYVDHGMNFPFFIRAAQKQYFRYLATITGIGSGDELRVAITEGRKRLGTERWTSFKWDRSFGAAMNFEKLDTLV
jgi:hypothetical protein